MRKATILATTVLVFVILVLACTKDIRLVTNVELSFTQSNTESGFVQELLPTTLIITPEAFLPEFEYYVSYEVLEGNGVFLNEEDQELPINEDIILIQEEDALEFLLQWNYKANSPGIHKVKVTASDNFEKAFSATLVYDIKDVPVVWTATSPLKTAEEGQEIPITLTFAQKEVKEDISYQAQYTFSEGSGTLLDSDGNAISLGILKDITFGTQEFTFVPNQVGNAIVQFELKDSNGQSLIETLNFTITEFIIDLEAPIITPIGNNPLIIFTGSTYTDPGATATDNKDEDATVTAAIVIDASAVNTAVVDDYIVTYTTKDQAGNIGNATRTVRVQINTSDVPQFTVKGASSDFTTTLELGTLYTIGSIDNPSDNGSIESTDIIDQNNIANTIPTEGNYTVVYMATDNDGNTTTITETIVVEDTIAPTFSIKGNTGNFITNLQAGAIFTPGTIDNIADQSTTDGGKITDLSGISNIVPTIGNYELTYTVIDAESNTTTIKETILVTDTSAPTFTVKGSSIDFTTTLELGVTYTLGTIDNIIDNGNTDSGVIVDTDAIDGTTPEVGTYRITYTVTDDQDNSTVIVETVIFSDTTPPDFTVKGNSDSFTTNIIFGGSYSVGTIDNPSDLSTFSQSITGQNDVDTNTAGSYIVTYLVKDEYENTKTIVETVIVGPKNTPAKAVNDDGIEVAQNISTAPSSVLIPVTSNDTNPDALGLTVVVAAINEPNNGTVQIVGTDINYTPNLNYIGTDSFVYTLTDSDNNSPTQARVNITVKDATKPVITLNGATPVTIELNIGNYTELGATVTDNQPLTQTMATVGGDAVNTSTLDSYTVNYTATDAAGNDAIPVTRTVNVVDTTKPVITRNGAATINLFTGGNYTELGAAVTDNNPATGNTAAIGGDTVNTATAGTYNITYSKTDPSGNSASTVERTVIVSTRNNPPVAKIIASPNGGEAPVEITFNGSTSSDPDGDPITYSWSIGGTSSSITKNYASEGFFSVTLTVTDNKGAENSKTIQISITDNICDGPPPEGCPNGTSFCIDVCECRNTGTGPNPVICIQ